MCRTPATGTFFQTLFTLLFSFEIKLFIQDHDSSSADLPANLPVLLTKSSRTLLCIQKCGSNCTFLSTFRWQFSIDDTLPYLAINVSEWQILYVKKRILHMVPMKNITVKLELVIFRLLQPLTGSKCSHVQSHLKCLICTIDNPKRMQALF